MLLSRKKSEHRAIYLQWIEAELPGFRHMAIDAALVALEVWIDLEAHRNRAFPHQSPHHLKFAAAAEETCTEAQ